ncbi:unnamed protein product [Heligmosomoides polygyrus]|uniref:DDE-1 domain-containing protein n=1 Tax=Heligmosomoides polygyrus TaxID=6339 RepID=A0A183FWW5_HELPZ|nr:unnamed protein product [Heligmosomoides polygyrus]
MKKKILERCKKLLQRFTVARAREIAFSDEKIFTLNPVFNVQIEKIRGDSLADAAVKGRPQERRPGKVLKPWTDFHFGEAYWCFQQDFAPARKAKVVEDWCDEQLPDFIAHNEWPSNSADLSPMAYSVWTALEKKTCSTRHSQIQALLSNLDSPKEALLKSWDEIDEPYLRATCEAFVELLKDFVEAEGDHFGNC